MCFFQINWLVVWFAQDPTYLYASRLLGGFLGGGGYLIAPMFLTEITDDRIRGALLSAIYASENFGLLLAYIIGNYFDYYAMPLFSIGLTATFALLILFLPEAPLFLMRQNKIEVSFLIRRRHSITILLLIEMITMFP